MYDKSDCLCRDCFHVSSFSSRCQKCGSPRLVRHDELFELSIAHIDCDAFYASVEKRDDPALSDLPVIIGGGRRGVVSTACYIARIHGVKSAMPMFKALKLCPDAVIIKPDMEKYVAVSKKIRKAMEELTPLVEPLSIDEAFLDMTGTERLHKMRPAECLSRFAANIEERIGVTVSVGLSHNKFLAKVASDMDKPRGFSVIGKAETREFIRSQPITVFWGVGKKTQEKLKSAGYQNARDIQNADETKLIKSFGTFGQRLYRLANGEDTRDVRPNRGTKSVSSETTFNTDVSGKEELTIILRRLSEKVSNRLKGKELCGRTITLKLKTATFRTLTRSHTLPDPTQLADQIFRVGLDLLTPLCDETAYRLIGIGVSDLKNDEFADPMDLLDEDKSKRADAERAVDKIRNKFGKETIDLGLIFKKRP